MTPMTQCSYLGRGKQVGGQPTSLASNRRRRRKRLMNVVFALMAPAVEPPGQHRQKDKRTRQGKDDQVG